MSDFSRRLIAWQHKHGRHDLPWSGADPYRVWLSEIMLQQTQVATVVGYFERFLVRFPDIAALAAASQEDVLALWSGLGYYARARNLHRAARIVMEQYGGQFPRQPEQIQQLPGIGRSTAAAIAAFCFNARSPILDGNVKRVFARQFGMDGDPAARATEERMWQTAQALLPAAAAMPRYTQALMDLGATLCTRSRPRCDQCPVAASCVARAENRVAELPSPRARRVKPNKSARYLLAWRGDEVFLEIRPPAGIWGGLLVPPEIPPDAVAADWCRRELGLNVAFERELAPLRHVFTHFVLDMRALVCRVQGSANLAAEAHGRWVKAGQLAGAALPAPVRLLLDAALSSARRADSDIAE
ncbi:MAG: A/G-specific adenine glycosylase [Rhodocyclaceae bacterium]|nr:A/G-specific adenine glycosylase [Rhodocyclaceae bacterium]